MLYEKKMRTCSVGVVGVRARTRLYQEMVEEEYPLNDQMDLFWAAITGLVLWVMFGTYTKLFVLSDI